MNINSLKKYYNYNIDTYINWILFINSFKDVSSVGIFGTAPIIENIRNKAYESVDSLEVNPYIIAHDIRSIIKELLIEYNLEELVKYLDSLEEDKVIEYTISNYIRNIILSLEYNSYSTILKRIELKDDYVPYEITDDLAEYYLETLRIKKEDNSDIREYILSTLSILATMLKIEKRDDIYLEMIKMIVTITENEEIETLYPILKTDSMLLEKNEKVLKLGK